MTDIIDQALAEAEQRERIAAVAPNEPEPETSDLPEPEVRRRLPKRAHLISHGNVSKSATYHDVNWEKAPLARALALLSDFKRAYESAAQIVLRRQSVAPQMLTCWTQLHKSKVARSVLAQCKGEIPDGKWVFRDDGAFVIKDGVKVSEPAVCCSMLCYINGYQKARVPAGLSRH
jgi:hypothetical protein